MAQVHNLSWSDISHIIYSLAFINIQHDTSTYLYNTKRALIFWIKYSVTKPIPLHIDVFIYFNIQYSLLNIPIHLRAFAPSWPYPWKFEIPCSIFNIPCSIFHIYFRAFAPSWPYPCKLNIHCSIFHIYFLSSRLRGHHSSFNIPCSSFLVPHSLSSIM